MLAALHLGRGAALRAQILFGPPPLAGHGFEFELALRHGFGELFAGGLETLDLSGGHLFLAGGTGGIPGVGVAVAERRQPLNGVLQGPRVSPRPARNRRGNRQDVELVPETGHQLLGRFAVLVFLGEVVELVVLDI